MKLSIHKDYSELRLKELRNRISQIEELRKNELCVYTTGSYGRLEASENSDIDLFFIDTNCENQTSNLDKTLINAEIIKICRNLDLQEFSKDGLYLNIHKLSDIKTNLGSPADDYKNYFTARMLMLLESKHLYNQELYDFSVKQLIESYFVDFHDHTINFKPVFLANDIIRFWKTLCLNYEHRRRRKQSDGVESSEKYVAHSKNLKLKFSRKLTCFSFLLKLVDQEGIITREDVRNIVNMTPVERLVSLKENNPNLAGKIQTALNSYQWFIDKTQVPSEEMLQWISDRKERDNAFEKSRTFGQEIYDILDEIDKQSILPQLLI
jgi:hypothetical protein